MNGNRPQRVQRTNKPTNNSKNSIENRQQMFDDEYEEPVHNNRNQNMTTDEKIEQIERERKRKIKKVIITIIVVILVMVALGVGFYFLSTGLNDKRVVSLNEEVAALEATIALKEDKIDDLMIAVADTTVKEVVPETSLQRVEGSEVPQLWLIEGDFIAPNKLELPTVTDDVNNSNIQIGSMFKFVPSENWLITIKGTTVEFSHPTKIWGKVKALGHRERVYVEADMKQIIQNFFIGYPETTISYRKIFFEDLVSGYMGKADIKVKDIEAGTEKVMTLNVGFAQRGDYTISFLFANDKENIVAQELIDLFLKSISFGDSKLKIE